MRALVGDQLRDRLMAEGGRMPEERRLVSAIFADLSGFTPLAGTLDPETLAAIVDPILAGLVRIVKRGEGYVGSFAGDALLAYFGAPVAHEDDAERAVRCAQEMLEEFPALLASVPPEGASLSLRIGIDTGAVMARLVAGDIKTDYNVLGNSVNMAQRLQSNAPPGGCVVGETTYRLARTAFEFKDLGGLTVKGRSTPLPAWLLLGEHTRAVQRRDVVASLVGREAELAALADAQRPEGDRVVVLVAEAGAGKSRLLQEARRVSTWEWLEGGCAQHDSTRSYRPWAAALFELSGRTGHADLDGLRILRGEGLDGPLAALSHDARRDLVATDVAEALRRAAPVVAVVEDLHWADPASLDLFDDLAHLLHDEEVLLLATSRAEVPTTTPVQMVTLPPLEERQVSAIATELLGGEPPEVLVQDLTRRSGGNPLYVAELAHTLLERGLVRLVEGGVIDAHGHDLDAALDLVPDSLEGLVGARIDALTTAEERTLTIAAVLGEPVDEQGVVAVAAQLALPHAEVPVALEALRERRLIDGNGFVHAVVPSTAYLRITRARRRSYHLAAAACADRVAVDERCGYLARHLYLGGAGPRAVDALARAVDDALVRRAHDEAVLHLRREVEVSATDEATAAQRESLPRRLTLLGELLEVMGRYEEAEEAFASAAGAGAGPEAQRGRVGCLRRLGQYDEAVRLADEVLASGALEPSVAARLSEERGWALAARGDFDQAVESLSAPASAVDAARHDILRGYCWGETGRADDARTVIAAAHDVLVEHGELATAARALRTLGEVEGASGDLEAAERTLTAGLELARRGGAAEETAACLSFLSMVAGITGDIETAIARGAEAVIASDRLRQPNGRATTRNNLAFSLYLSERHYEAIRMAEEALFIARSAELPTLQSGALHTRGSARLKLGDVAGAILDAREAVALGAAEGNAEEALDLLALAESAAPPHG